MLGWLYLWSDRARARAATKRLPEAHALGRRGEDLAHRFLRQKGFTIIARNYRTPSGRAEADLIAVDGNVLVFVEVKTLATREFSLPERAVDTEKQRRIAGAAEAYIRQANRTWDLVRFDIVSVVVHPKLVIDHFAGAFRTADR